MPDKKEDLSPALAIAHPWVRRLTRLGFIARGVLYSLLGVLTLWSLIRQGRNPRAGMHHTFDSINSIGPGVLLLAGLAIGFAGFAIGMMWTAIFNWNFEKKDTLGWVRRAGTFITGLVHISLVASSILLILGHQPESHSTRRWTELALSYPFGREIVTGGGLYAIGFGLFLFSKVLTGRLDLLLDLTSLRPRQAILISVIGRFGMLARSVIYVTIGLILALAGFRGDASNVVGYGGAMHTVGETPYGLASLAIVSCGLLAYGIFMFIEARYRRIGEPRPRRARRAH